MLNVMEVGQHFGANLPSCVVIWSSRRNGLAIVRDGGVGARRLSVSGDLDDRSPERSRAPHARALTRGEELGTTLGDDATTYELNVEQLLTLGLFLAAGNAMILRLTELLSRSQSPEAAFSFALREAHAEHVSLPAANSV